MPQTSEILVGRETLWRSMQVNLEKESTMLDESWTVSGCSVVSSDTKLLHAACRET